MVAETPATAAKTASEACDIALYGSAQAAQSYRIHAVARLLENAKRQGHSGIWLSVEEIEAVMQWRSSAPIVEEKPPSA